MDAYLKSTIYSGNLDCVKISQGHQWTKDTGCNISRKSFPSPRNGIKFDSKYSSLIQEDLEWERAAPEHHLVPYDSKYYPPLLREIKGAPPLLFVRGNLDLLLFPSFGIVGSRKPSREGLKNARFFSTYVSRQGFCIVSGLAYGIDRIAHESSLKGKGKTIAIIGTGIDLTYPSPHQKLADEIVANEGAIVSVFPRGTRPLAYNFPARNRIISGVSLGLLVVEAGIKSGAMISARFAAEQGREVFAIPGSIHNPLAKGTNHLIKQGANLAQSYQDIIDDILPAYQAYRDKLSPCLNFSQYQYIEQDEKTEQHPALNMAAEEERQKSVKSEITDPLGRKIMLLLAKGALSPDELEDMISAPIDKINSALVMLELGGVVHKENGSYYRT